MKTTQAVESHAPPRDHDPEVAVSAKLQLGSRPAAVLIVDQDGSTWTLRRRLERTGAHVRSVEAGDELLAAAQSHAPDLILLNLRLRDDDVVSLIRALRNNPLTHTIPIMVIGTPAQPRSSIQCLDAGACDYILRPFSVAEVVARIRVVVRLKSREDSLKQRLRFLEELAASDPLTSLLNRRALDERLYLEMERAAQSGQPLSCLILDIDWFKGINDRYGHHVGDDVLRQIAKVILERRRDGDVVCRYGGEEFVWLLPGMGRHTLLEWAEWLRRTIEETEVPTAEGPLRVSVSIGASAYQLKEHGRVPANLLIEQADTSLLEAKRQGKNRVVFRDPVSPARDEKGFGNSAYVAKAGARSAGELLGVDLWPSTEASPGDGMLEQDDIQREISDLVDSSAKVLIAALEAKDAETMAHSQRVANTAAAIAMDLGLSPGELDAIKFASLFHDLGKLAVPESILLKQGPLSAQEREIVKKHPERGAAILQGAKSFRHLVPLVLYHQESFDGTGYPDGLRGQDIPLGARIIRIADVFDALTSDRPYRPRMSLHEAQAELQQMAGKVLDPEIVERFVRLLATMSPLEIQLTLWRQGWGDSANDGATSDVPEVADSYYAGTVMDVQSRRMTRPR